MGVKTKTVNNCGFDCVVTVGERATGHSDSHETVVELKFDQGVQHVDAYRGEDDDGVQEITIRCSGEFEKGLLGEAFKALGQELGRKDEFLGRAAEDYDRWLGNGWRSARPTEEFVERVCREFGGRGGQRFSPATLGSRIRMGWWNGERQYAEVDTARLAESGVAMMARFDEGGERSVALAATQLEVVQWLIASKVAEHPGCPFA